MPDTKRKMLQWLNDDGTAMGTPGTLVVAETTGETFNGHSTDTAKHHAHANAASLDKLTVDADGLKVNGVGVGGIAIVASPDATPVYNGKLRILITEYPPAEV